MFCSIKMNFFFKTFPPLLVSTLLKTVYFKLNLEVITQDSDQLVLVLKPVKSFFSALQETIEFCFPQHEGQTSFFCLLGNKVQICGSRPGVELKWPVVKHGWKESHRFWEVFGQAEKLLWRMRMFTAVKVGTESLWTPSLPWDLCP